MVVRDKTVQITVCHRMSNIISSKALQVWSKCDHIVS